MSLFRNRKAEAATAAASEQSLAEELVVLRDVMARYPAGTVLNFGAPCRCPDCGNFGFAETVNAGTARNHCHSCNREWVITLRALRAYRSDPALQVPHLPMLAEAAPTMGWSPPARPDRDPSVMRPLDAETARFASVRWVPPPVSTPPLAATPSDDHPRDRQPAPGEEAVEKAAEAVPVGGASRSTIDLDEPAPLGEGLVLLVVDDNPFDLALIEELADELGPLAITVLHAPTLVDGMARARAGPVDVVLLNLDLPDSSGLATMVEWQLQPGRKVPIVALVEHGETDLIRGAKAAGAKQVVQKRHLTQLAEDPVTGSRRLEQLLRRASGTLVSPG